jgi:hypothetical protein
MDIVRDAVLKVRDYKSQQVMSGFVFDNGRLPDNTGPFDQLIGPSTLQTFEEKEPYFFYNSGTSSVKLSDLSNNNDTELTLFKGYRAGAYLSFGLDSETEFRDAWGNDFNVTSDTSYSFTLEAHTTPYDTPYVISITPNNWATSVDQINNLKINLNNATGSDYPNMSTKQFYIVLFVYGNNISAGKNEWVNYRSNLIDLDFDANPKKQLSEGISQYILTKKLFDGDEIDIENTDLIPAGTHLIALIDKSNFDSTPVDGKISYQNDTLPNPLNEPSYQKFTLFPGSSLPELKLTIKK